MLIDLKDTMLTFHLTTDLPIRLYSKDWKLVHELSNLTCPFFFLDNLDTACINNKIGSDRFTTYRTKYYESYLIWQLKKINDNSLHYLVIGPMKSYSPSDFEINGFLKTNNLSIEDSHPMGSYFNSLKTVPHGSYKMYFELINKLFDINTTEVIRHQQGYNDQAEIAKKRKKIDYITSGFYHHNYLLEKKVS